MAGLTWFEQDIDFIDHPKTIALRSLLRNPLAEAYVSRVWAYCYRYATDRFSGAAAEATVEQAARWKGKDGVLVAALLDVRYLERDGSDLVAHGVGERLAPHLAKRERDATRARERRDEVAKSVGHPGGVAATSARRPRDVSGDRDRDKDRDLSEITIVSDPDPVPARPPARANSGGRAGEGVNLGSTASEVLSRVAAGLGHALAPFTSQADADEFERRIELFSRSEEEAIDYFAATCRRRTRKPESAKVLLLMLRDLAPAEAVTP